MTYGKRPLLAIDIGNTRIKCGLFTELSTANGLPVPARVLELAADGFDPDQVIAWLRAAGIDAPADGRWRIASVNRPPARLLMDWLECSNVKPLQPEHGDPSRNREAPALDGGYCLLKYGDLPLLVSLPEPECVGIDRLLGAVAVNRLRKPNRAAVVIDVGSAITVDLVSADGTFLGGAILPGIGMSARAMHKFTDLLPMIAIDELANPPEALGTSTIGAMRSGLYWGSIGAMKELVVRLTESLPRNDADPEIFLTGGAAPVVAKSLGPDAAYNAHLVLGGIAVADSLRP